MAWGVAGNIRGPQGPAGPQGGQGIQGEPGPVGPAGLQWRGAWSGANSYAINDHVTWGGSSYYATATHAIATAPPTGTAGTPDPDDTAVNAGWALLTLQGSTGPQGPTGPQGDVGPAGPDGPAGSAGATGATGARGSNWYTGVGAPGVIAGAVAGDKYLDTASGDVYTLS